MNKKNIISLGIVVFCAVITLGTVSCKPAKQLEIKDNFTPPEMIWVAPGTFNMGSSTSELGREDDEKQHNVTIRKGFWLGKYPVTQAEYKAVLGDHSFGFYGENLPVESVTWYEATNFCAKLTEIERAIGRLPKGYEYTLPTEAQWEYACRAGTTTAFNNGTDIPTEDQMKKDPCPNMDELGWYYLNSDSKTHPVGQKKPNAWGFYDMHGNVWEWCLDWYGFYPTNSAIDPTGPEEGTFRVIRGGTWLHHASQCRSAYRDYNRPRASDKFSGFRVALSAVAAE